MSIGRRVGVAIVGTGFGVTTHYPAWAGLGDVRIMGFAGRDAHRASNMSRHFGLAIAAGDHETLLASPDVDVVVLAVPPQAQPPLIEAALRSGKHVFAEKPLALSVEDGARLVELAESRGVRHGVNFCLRRADAFMAIKRAITDGRIGQPWRAVVTWHRGYRADKTLDWNWKCDAALGGGIVNALGAHVLDLLIWFFDDVSSGSGMKHIHIPMRRGARGEEQRVTAEDAASITLRFASNVTALVSLDSTALGGGGLTVDIYGEDGALHLRQAPTDDVLGGFSVSITDKQGGRSRLVGDQAREAKGRVDLVRMMAANFVESVRDGGPFSPNFSDGLRVATGCARIGWIA